MQVALYGPPQFGGTAWRAAVGRTVLTGLPSASRVMPMRYVIRTGTDSPDRTASFPRGRVHDCRSRRRLPLVWVSCH
jgi:hypothetical protein